MRAQISQHKALLLLLSLSFLYLLILSAPDITWRNVDSDGADYLLAIKNLSIPHPTGSPLFMLDGYVWLWLFPGTNDFWALSILSALFTVATIWVLYREARSLWAPLIFLASAVVVSQSIIVELYSQVTFFMVLAYKYRERPRLCGLIAAFGLGIHHLMLFTLIPIALTRVHATKQFRSVLAYWPAFLGLLFYLYIPLANRPPYIAIRGESLKDYLNYFFSQGFIPGGIDPFSVDMVLRLEDASRILLGTFGLLLPLLLLAMKRRMGLLAVLTLGPFATYFLNLDPVTFTYAMPSFAFGALLLSQEIQRHPEWIRMAAKGTVVGFLAYNLAAFDIGTTLDPAPTTARQLLNQAEQLPEGAVVYTRNRGWENTTLRLIGVKAIYDDPNDAGRTMRALAANICNLYQTVIVNPETYQTKIEKYARCEE